MMETGNNTKPEAGQLLIRISRPGGISFSALNSANEALIDYEPYTMRRGVSPTANLREALKACALPRNSYDSVVTMVDSPVMLSPQEMFDEAAATDLYRYTFTGHDTETVISKPMADLEVVASFAVSKDLVGLLADSYAHVDLLPVVLPVWEHLYRRSQPGLSRKLYGYFHDKRLDLFSFHNGRFDYANTFNATHAHDALYYMLYAFKQLGMNADSDELHVVGQIPSEDWLLERLRLYVARAYVVKPTAEYNRHPLTAIKDIPYDLTTYYLG